jgi:excisionase family DNA binding protein
MPIEKLTYSVAEAAAQLGVSKVTLYARMREGQVRSFLWGGRRLIRDDDLRAAIALARGGPEPVEQQGHGGQHDTGGQQPKTAA